MRINCILGLEKKDPIKNSISGIWNGEKFVFTESKWQAITFIKMIYRYGFEPIKLNRYFGDLKYFQSLKTIPEESLRNTFTFFENASTITQYTYILRNKYLF